MKVAICISGLARNIEHSLKSISIIKNTGDVKVFIHTWAAAPGKNEHLISTSFNSTHLHSKDLYTHLDVANQFSFEKLQLDFFENASKNIMNYVNKYKISLQRPNIIGRYCMFYSFQQVEKLKSEFEEESGETFDMVYRMRFDSNIKNPEVLPTSPFEQETIAIPDQYNWGGINDQFAYGTSQTMKKYFNSFSVFPLLKQTYFGNTEALLEACILYQKLPLIRTNLKVQIHNR